MIQKKWQSGCLVDVGRKPRNENGRKMRGRGRKRSIAVTCITFSYIHAYIISYNISIPIMQAIDISLCIQSYEISRSVVVVETCTKKNNPQTENQKGKQNTIARPLPTLPTLSLLIPHVNFLVFSSTRSPRGGGCWGVLNSWLILFRPRRMCATCCFRSDFNISYILIFLCFFFSLLVFMVFHLLFHRCVRRRSSWRISSARIMPPLPLPSCTTLHRYLWSCFPHLAVTNSADRDRHYLPHQVRTKETKLKQMNEIIKSITHERKLDRETVVKRNNLRE